MDDSSISRDTSNGNSLTEKLVLKIKVLDIVADANIVILNSALCKNHSIYPTQKIILNIGNNEIAFVVDTSNSLVGSSEIGLFRDFANKHNLTDGEKIEVKPLTHPRSLDYIKKKINNLELSESEIMYIIEDVMDNKLGEVEIAAMVTAMFAYDLTDAESISMIKAILATGKSLNLGVSPVADKHCIGGVAGNRTTMLIVPIVAAAEVYIPKTSSRAISSAAGTADTMEAIANVSLSIEEMEEIVRKSFGCIVWGGALNLAAADDKLIRIRHPLGLDPEGLLLASILAKKKSVNAQQLVVDIPIGNGAKIADIKVAERLASRFKKLGAALGINTSVMITDGSSPIGYGVGAYLECIDVLKVLENNRDCNVQLKDKACMIAGKLLEMSGKSIYGQGFENAKGIVESGKALFKFKEIVELQGGKPNIRSSDLKPANNSATVYAHSSGTIMYIDNKAISKIARIAGAPKDKGAGVFLYCASGKQVKKGQAIMEIFSDSETKLSEALKYADNAGIYTTRQFAKEV